MNYFSKKLSLLILLLFVVVSTFAQNYKYESVPNDPTATRIYTLNNGLKVYLSVNKDQPRIQTSIAVKTGSKNDPADVTGLAHYLEHMLFKGTSHFSTLNWEKEKVLLKQISDMYELNKAEKVQTKKNLIYAKIDSLSGEAAKFAIPNEYDKMISSLGAQGTNAYTSNEQTVYVNDIPSTEMEKWMTIEAERFSELVLRLFHTELEAVFEEFNRGQDNDYSKAYHAMSKLMFPTHPYGTQTTIGLGEHLKNPSMVKIHEYFDKYYVANNMAICMAGDFDYDQTIAMIDKHFGKLLKKEVIAPKMPIEKPQTAIVQGEVYGPMSEWVALGFRVGGYHTKDALMSDLFSSLLSNGSAGLIDLNLTQKQKILSGSCYTNVMHDYASIELSAEPKQGQTLEEVRDLLLAEIDKVRKGDFTEDLMKAIVKNAKKDMLSRYESNNFRTYRMIDAFILEANWKDVVEYYTNMGKITKQQLVDWTKMTIKDNNYCLVYKRNGDDKNIYKVEKPQITPVTLNRDVQSDFSKRISTMESIRLKPEFVDLKTAITEKEIVKDVPLYYIKNKTNELFTLFIEVDKDLAENKNLEFAMKYLPFLGTDKYSAEDLKRKFYDLGVSYQANTGNDLVYIYMDGLNESFDEALKLLEHVLKNCKADETVLKNMIEDVKMSRENDMKSKGQIMYNGLVNYAKYGPINPFNDHLTNAELDQLKSEDLIKLIRDITSYKHTIFYYGPSENDVVYTQLKTTHELPNQLKKLEKTKDYQELTTGKNMVYFVDYDMVQTELMMLSRGEIFNDELTAKIELFNSYFGSGLSSVVFQEIRESKALAYSAYAYYSSPMETNKSHYVEAYLGTQSNKMGQAVEAMLALMNTMPKAEIQFNDSKLSALKSIESNRVTKSSLYWFYRYNKRLGRVEDPNKKIYEELGKMNLNDMEAFFNSNIKGKNYVYCVIGKKGDVDMEALKKLGEVKELTLEELFNY